MIKFDTRILWLKSIVCMYGMFGKIEFQTLSHDSKYVINHWTFPILTPTS